MMMIYDDENYSENTLKKIDSDVYCIVNLIVMLSQVLSTKLLLLLDPVDRLLQG